MAGRGRALAEGLEEEELLGGGLWGRIRSISRVDPVRCRSSPDTLGVLPDGWFWYIWIPRWPPPGEPGDPGRNRSPRKSTRSSDFHYPRASANKTDSTVILTRILGRPLGLLHPYNDRNATLREPRDRD